MKREVWSCKKIRKREKIETRKKIEIHVFRERMRGIIIACRRPLVRKKIIEMYQ